MMSNQKKIIIYYSCINKIGGIETWIYNLCVNLRDYYDITVLCDSVDKDQLDRLKKFVDVQIYSSRNKYVCDVFLDSYQWKDKTLNVSWKKNIAVIHCDYGFFKDAFGLKISKDADEFICVSQHVKDSLIKNYDLGGRPAYVIENILAPLPKRKLRIVSAMRMAAEKGYNRMLKLCKLFKENDIPFEWKIFTSTPIKTPYSELVCYKQTLNIIEEIKNADYLAQLSDSEGFCYSVLEALQCHVPVLVTDIPGFKDVVYDGYNGYKFSLEMDNVNVDKIYNHIPQTFDFDDCIEQQKNKWITCLGDPVYVKKEQNVTVKIIRPYYDILLNKSLKRGDIIDVTGSRANELVSNKVCEIMI